MIYNKKGMALVSTRPQIPRDLYGMGKPWHQDGTMPPGGFRAMWNFGQGAQNVKESPTTGGGKKVY